VGQKYKKIIAKNALLCHTQMLIVQKRSAMSVWQYLSKKESRHVKKEGSCGGLKNVQHLGLFQAVFGH